MRVLSTGKRHNGSGIEYASVTTYEPGKRLPTWFGNKSRKKRVGKKSPDGKFINAPHTPACGSRNGNSKLSEAARLEIVEMVLVHGKSKAEAARKFDVDWICIHRFLRKLAAQSQR